jgi:N-acetyl-anhydromuramyl-L-alanine amidase AmpD
MIDSQAQWIPSPFYTAGRPAGNPRWLILHGTAGGSSAQNIAAWFQNPSAQVSAHYVIGQDGKIVACVDESNWAWANGVLSTGHDPWWTANINPNWVTISIEHVKPDTSNATALTTAQQASSFALIKRICQRWNIPMRAADANGGITGHYSIDPINRKDCPGTYPWAALWSYLGSSTSSSTTTTSSGENEMLNLTDPVVKDYFVAGDNGTWRCKNNGVILQNANLTFYRTYGGPALLGLPLTNEYYPQAYPGTAIVPCERAILCYDPARKIDKPPIGGQVYLMHINNGIGQQIISQSPVNDLNKQINNLKTQLSTANTQLEDANNKLKAAEAALAEAQDTSALEGQIKTLQDQAISYTTQIQGLEKQIATYQANLKQIAQLASVA